MQGMAALTEREHRYRRALDTIMRALDINDRQLATALGISRESARLWHTGGVRLRLDQCEQVADALNVSLELFDQEPDEVLRWLADNRPEQVFAASGCISESAAYAMTG